MAPLDSPQFHTPIVLAGYTGSGKDTIAKGIVDSSSAWGSRFQRSTCRFTDRDARPGEVQGVDAHFVSPEAFQEHNGHGDFFFDYHKYGQNFAFSYSVLQTELAKAHSFIIGGEIDTAHRLFSALEDRMRREGGDILPIMVFVNRALGDILAGIEHRPGSQEEKDKRMAHVTRNWEEKPRLLRHMEDTLGPNRVKYIWNDNLAEATQETRTFIGRAIALQGQQEPAKERALDPFHYDLSLI